MRVGLYHQVKNGGAGAAEVEGFAEEFEDQIALVVGGIYGNVLGEGLGGFIELEAGEDVKGEAFASEGEEVAAASPGDEVGDQGFVELGLEE